MTKNFVIVGTQRTGSGALLRSLNSHPEIACGAELVQDIPFFRKIELSKRALTGDFSRLTDRGQRLVDKRYRPGIEWLGFKVLFRSSDKWFVHPRLAPANWFDQLENFVGWFRSEPKLHVIHVVRDDPMDWLKSKYLAGNTGHFAVTPYPKGMTVEIPVRSAVKRIVAKDWVDRRLNTLAGSNPYFRVSYEDFLQSNRRVLAGLMEFLGCDMESATDIDYERHRKQSVGSAQDYISNYEEIYTALRDRGLVAESVGS